MSSSATPHFVSTEQSADAAQGSYGFLGRYRLDRIIGHGAMGTVFEAYDAVLSRSVALKTLQSVDKQGEPGDALSDAAILQEARVAATLSHPHIVTVHDAGRAASSSLHRDLPYVAMEKLEGQDLRQYMAQKPPVRMRVRDAVALVGKVALALDMAHKKGILHRDIKPANIFLTLDGQPKILDFGLAQITRRSALNIDELATTPVVQGGSPQYMSPEFIRSMREPSTVVDLRSDVYSLGVVLYELLCGHAPFKAPTLKLLHALICTEPAVEPHQLQPDIPQDLSDLVMRALAKRPDERFRSAAQFARELKRWGRGLLDAELHHEGGPASVPVGMDAMPGADRIDDRAVDAQSRASPTARIGMATALVGALAVGLGVWHLLDAGPAAEVAAVSPASLTLPTANLASTSLGASPPLPTPAPELPVAAPASHGLAGPAGASTSTPAPVLVPAPAVTPATPLVRVPEPPQASAGFARPIIAKTAPAAAAPAVRVRLAVTPWGEVEVDGKPVGVSPPLTQLSLSPGEHTVVLRNSDFAPRSIRLQVQAKGNAPIAHRFE